MISNYLIPVQISKSFVQPKASFAQQLTNLKIKTPPTRRKVGAPASGDLLAQR
jgi:hypothetical protein